MCEFIGSINNSWSGNIHCNNYVDNIYIYI